MKVNLRSMPTGELSEVVNLFPWYSAARVELCKRLSRTGEAGFAEGALYAGTRSVLFEAVKESDSRSFTDKDIQKVLTEAPKKKVRALGGDFFSQDEYDSARRDGDDIMSRAVAKLPKEKPEGSSGDEIYMNFCTETLARIYAEQGYVEQAKYIYSKLSLLYPEKNAYFAALIEKLDLSEEIKN